MTLAQELAIQLAYERLQQRIRSEDRGYSTPCLIWQGAITTAGYGTTGIRLPTGKHKTTYTHRLAWLVEKGPIPRSLQIDHLCKIRECCNVEHLDLVTQRENTRRGKCCRAKSIQQTSNKNRFYKLRGLSRLNARNRAYKQPPK